MPSKKKSVTKSVISKSKTSKAAPVAPARPSRSYASIRAETKAISARLAKSEPVKSQRIAPASAKPGIAMASGPKATKRMQAPVSKPNQSHDLIPAQNWPQAMSAGGSAVAHVTGPAGPTVSRPANGPAKWQAAPARPDAAIGRASTRDMAAMPTWLSQWTKASEQALNAMRIGKIATPPLDAATLKGVLDQQIRMYQTLVRLSPLNLAFQGAMQGRSILMSMMQGLVPGAARSEADASQTRR